MLIMQRDGLLKESELAGGKSGKNMRYSMASVRGDVVRFVDGTEEEGCYNIGLLKEFSDQIVVRVQVDTATEKGQAHGGWLPQV
jgi:hypothetical protein